jgi:hypothetical protein
MNGSVLRFVRIHSTAAALLLALACTDSPPQDDPPAGRLEVALRTSGPEPGSFYGLAGTFVLDDPEGLVAAVGALELDRALVLEPRVGTHSLELCTDTSDNPACEGHSSWQLFRLECEGGSAPGTEACFGDPEASIVSTAVPEARLGSENPQDVSIQLGRTTEASLLFHVPGEGDVAFGRGRLSVGVAVRAGFPDGDACGAAVECMSHVCLDADDDGAATCQAPSCMDGIRNGDEALPDCGGSCGACASGFADSGQRLALRTTRGVELADLDGDGDLDAYACGDEADTIWLNDGEGLFTNRGVELVTGETRNASLGDLDGDGDVDALVAAERGLSVWLNDGRGNFARSGQSFPDTNTHAVGLGDLDGDGDLDAVTGPSGGAVEVWHNDASGSFSLAQSTATANGLSPLVVRLGQLDGDGELDAYFGTTVGDEVWLNDGRGTLTDLRELRGSERTTSVSLGDLDGDGDVDAYSTHGLDGEHLYINDGGGSFVLDTVQYSGDFASHADLGDLDLDGDLDVFATTDGQSDAVYLNDGHAIFTPAPSPPQTPSSRFVRLADLNGDGLLDAFVASDEADARVWLGE